MKLTVIIVSYNVRHFLEQCLKSVIKASHTLQVEIFVVDNCSEDDSVSMVRNKFPGVKLIVNPDNKGFSKANNQAIRISEGDYILLLNPDTVLEETALAKSTAFMETHPEAGGLGIKMIDGHGHFLSESKRGLPTPWASFCTMSHLSQLYPRSEFFNRYHAGHLDENKTNKIEVLAGAFMLLRRKVLDQIGLLDEDFFMYGEDIDLSFRITKAGYFNYYFPEARMIHYKGESTRKSSLNYVRLFYGAMLIFARKHFAEKNARLLSLVILPGVYFRATIAMIYRLLNSWSHSSAWSFFSGIFIKIRSSNLNAKTDRQLNPNNKAILIIANKVEADSIKDLCFQYSNSKISVFSIGVDNADPENILAGDNTRITCAQSKIKEMIKTTHPTEIIFSAADLTTNKIITLMCQLKTFSIPFRIAHTDNNTIIGSNFVSVHPLSKVGI